MRLLLRDGRIDVSEQLHMPQITILRHESAVLRGERGVGFKFAFHLELSTRGHLQGSA